MKYDDWVNSVPELIKGDAVWQMEVYRLGLFVSDIAWHDVTKLLGDARTVKLADQLYRAVGSITANIEEGYSYGTGKNRARYYQYALGSARESRGWYYKGRHILGEKITNHRMQLLTGIIRSLLVIVPKQKGYQLKEQQ
ncbi:MAG: four helix bundle protein, partial [Anaerolineales bacterium]|nr:four helix bundle protein [Anaerolineales bacterium]